MKQQRRKIFHLFTTLVWTFGIVFFAVVANAASAHEIQPTERADAARLPLHFVPNAGQFAEGVAFVSHQGRYTLLVGATETTLVGESWGDGSNPSIVRMAFVDPNPALRVEGRERLPGVANFYQGNDPEAWRSGLPTWGTTARVDLYPGITQVYRAGAGLLKSEFLVSPGAEPAQIRMAYSGIEGLEISVEGELVVRTTHGELRESTPVAFQQIGPERRIVEAHFALLGDDQVGFHLGPYDPAHELVIDPVIAFSTYLGGNHSDKGDEIAIDDAGNILVVGSTRSTDFPLAAPVQASKAGPTGTSSSAIDFFVAKLDPTGSVLLYSTYLGGSSRELGGDIAIDGEGNVYIKGWTTSTDFPTTAGVFGPSPFGVGGSVDDAVIAKLSPSGTLVYSTYLGGSSDDQPEDIAVDADGHAYVMGRTVSPNFPISSGAYQSTLGGWDIFVTKLTPDASGIVYSTFIGGRSYEEPRAMGLDAAGNVYVVGRTHSSGYPVTAGAYDTVYNGTDTVALTKLNASGGDLVYSTFLDGIVPRFGAEGFGVAVDASGNAHVILPSEGNGFPATPGAWDTTFNGGSDGVVMKVNAAGSGLLYSTFLGGLGNEQVHGLVLDDVGNAWVTGYTDSADFPLVDPLPGHGLLGGGRDAFIVRLNASGDNLDLSTFIGGSANDSGNGIALQGMTPCIVGDTASADFPTTAGAFQPTTAPINDAFVLCLGDGGGNEPPVTCEGWHWTFDEGFGTTAADVSTHGADGTLIGEPDWVTGQQAGALTCGDGGYVRIDDNDELDLVDALTIAAWVKPAAVGSTQMLLSKDNAYEFELGKAGADAYSLRLNNITAGQGATPVRAGVWQHLAVTWDGSTVRYYYNGVPDGSAPFAGPLATNDTELGLCARPYDTYEGCPVFFLDGRLDDVRLHGCPLSDTEIADLVSSTSGDLAPPVTSAGAPSGPLADGATEAVVSLTTDEDATCRYGTTPDTPFDAMAETFDTTGGTLHSTLFGGLVDGQLYRVYVRCQDAPGNTNLSDYQISFGGPTILGDAAGFWRFDETSGCTAADAWGGNSGTLGPSCATQAPQWTPGVLAGGLTFAGGGQQVLVPPMAALTELNEITVAAWIRHDPASGYHSIVDQRDANYDGYDLYIEPSSKLFMRVNSVTVTSGAVVADGSWHHVVGVYGGGEMRLYIDGVLDATASAGSSAISTSAPLRFGEHFSGTGASFVGEMDEVSIYGRGLSALEVGDLYLALQ